MGMDKEAKMSGEPKAIEKERLEKIINDFSELYGGLYEGDGKNIVFSEHYQMASRLRWAEEEIVRLRKDISERAGFSGETI